MHSFTCRRILQELFQLCWCKLCASDGHHHTKLCELHLDVVLLQKTEQCCGRDPLGGAVRRAFHQVNGHVCPVREKQHSDRDRAPEPNVPFSSRCWEPMCTVVVVKHVRDPYWSLGRALTPSTLTVRVWLLPRILWRDSTSCCCWARTSASFLLITMTTKPSSSLLTGTQL